MVTQFLFVKRVQAFPLIQLPRKSEVANNPTEAAEAIQVSINSTSEEVRSLALGGVKGCEVMVSINSTSEEVRRVGF